MREKFSASMDLPLTLRIPAYRFFFEGHHGAVVFLSDITERKREQMKKCELEQQLRQASEDGSRRATRWRHCP